MTFMEFLKKMFGKKEENSCGCQHEQPKNQEQTSPAPQSPQQPEEKTHTEEPQQ